MGETGNGDSASGRDVALMALGKFEVSFLFALYALGLVYSIYSLFFIFSSEPTNAGANAAYLRTLAFSAVAGSSTFYARKLYKAGINGDYSFDVRGQYIKRISTFSYYALRVPISIIFALILYSIWRLSIDVASDVGFVASEKAKYIDLLIGFFSGFSSGRILGHFEKTGFQIATTAGRSQ